MLTYVVAENRAKGLSASSNETPIYVSPSRSREASAIPQPPNRPVGIGIVECPPGSPRRVKYCCAAYAPSDADAVVDALVRFLETHPVGAFAVHTSVDIASRLDAIDANANLTNARSAYELVSDAINAERLSLAIGKASAPPETRLFARAKSAAREASREASAFFVQDGERYREDQKVNRIISWRQLPD